MVSDPISLPVPRRYLTAGIGAAVVSGLASFAALQTSGYQALALAALGGVSIAIAAGAFARFSGRGRLEAVIAEAVNKSAEATFVTAIPGERSQSFIYANPAFHLLFKVDGREIATPEDLVGLLYGSGEEQLEEFTRLEVALNASVPGHAVLAFRGLTGGVDWRRISVVPFSSGRYALWRAEDVTAERELDMIRRSEDEMLADFLDNLPAGFFSIDAHGRIQYANSVFIDWLGVPLEEMRTRNMRFSDFVVAARSDVNAGDDEGDDGDVTLRGAGDSLFKACLVQSEQTDDSGNMNYSRSILLRDLTWRGNAGYGGGTVTTTASHRQRWLFDEAPVGIVLLNLKGEVADTNRAFLKLLGVHRDTVVGYPFSDRIAKEDQGDVAAQLSKVVMGIMPASHLEVRMPAMGERELMASLYASRLEDDSGEVSGLALHFIDTTEQKNLEVQFAHSQKMQAVGQLAGGVAHDFNNLLTAMIGFSDLLLGRHGPDDPSFSDIMQIKQNANRATNLVRQLLAFSRQQTLEPTVLDVTEALSDLSNLLGRLIGENIELEISHERDLGLLLFDHGQFDQVIINLAVNARDAMPGGGTVMIKTSNVSLESAVQRGHDVMAAGEYVLIVVGDTGVGIAKEDL
ncbi:MAG: PAS domain-containing protein, partial [Rhodospirillaceae bacterium]|nr:PAS domain-containing protein [Rhodospirillaceae bacterium]